MIFGLKENNHRSFSNRKILSDKQVCLILKLFEGKVWKAPGKSLSSLVLLDYFLLSYGLFPI